MFIFNTPLHHAPIRVARFLFSATAGKHGVHLLVGVADVWKGRNGKKAEASVAFSIGLDAWNSHIITPSRRGYVVAALIQSLLQLLPDA